MEDTSMATAAIPVVVKLPPNGFTHSKSERGWLAPGEPAGSVARRTLANKKVLFCIWRDCHGVINKEYLKRKLTVSSTKYNNMLIKANNAIRGKRKKELKRRRWFSFIKIMPGHMFVR
ncbi:histone-lysine N-methyltransferase SETMAR [Trichonephila clavipes]|nr:histone-lysine N-methyltransferase SETMAR [Trichonephila clavipes]